MFQANDIMNAFFTGGGGQSSMQFASRGGGGGGGGGGRRPGDVAVEVSTTLEEMYSGATRQFTRSRTVLCGDCRGRGTKSNAVKTQTRCPMCRGAGARIIVQQMGMMAQRMQVVCDACEGTGVRVDPKDCCTRCVGKKMIQEPSTLTVTIPAGCKEDERIVLKGEGDVHPDMPTPGNVTVVIRTAKHSTFVRAGDDLHLSHSITLAEALCGFQFKLTHLDGREITIRRNRGEITRPGDMNMVKGEGMPVRGAGGRNGDLFLHLDITYPVTLTPDQLAVMEKVLPRPSNLPKVDEENDHQTCFASRRSVAAFRAAMEQEDIDDDDEDEGRGQGVHVGGCPVQ